MAAIIAPVCSLASRLVAFQWLVNAEDERLTPLLRRIYSSRVSARSSSRFRCPPLPAAGPPLPLPYGCPVARAPAVDRSIVPARKKKWRRPASAIERRGTESGKKTVGIRFLSSPSSRADRPSNGNLLEGNRFARN